MTVLREERKSPQWSGSTSGEPIPTGTPGAGAAGGAPGTPPEPPAAEGADAGAAAGADAPEAPPEGAAAKPRVMASDLPPEALKARLDQARNAAAREARLQVFRELGYEDPEKVDAAQERERRKKEAEELAKHKAAEDKRKRLAMTEAERLKADLETERQKRTELETRITELQEQSISDQQEVRVRAVALQHIDPEAYELVRLKFIEHVNALMATEPGKVEAMSERDIEKFFRDYAKKNPRYALAVEPAGDKKPDDKKPLVRRPITTGPGPRAPQPRPATTASTPDLVNGKSIRPGLPNSMTKKELNEYLASQGRRRWG